MGTRVDARAPSKDEMRLTLLAFGWRETIYGTFQPSGSDWHDRVWKVEAAYARVTGTKLGKGDGAMTSEELMALVVAAKDAIFAIESALRRWIR